MITVLVESPFAAPTAKGRERNLGYMRAALRDCLIRGEAPFASHALYTQPGVLDDNVAEERMLGIEAGLRWGEFARRTVVYCDLGISNGMDYGIAAAKEVGRDIEYRKLGGQWQ